MPSVVATVLLLILTLTPATSGAEWHEIPGGRWSTLNPPGNGNTGFTLLSPEAIGLVFTNKLRQADGAQNRTLYNGSGVATGDFDGDGLPDIALVGIEGRLALYKNLGNWTFTNVTAESGAIATNLMARGVVLADVTGDGALDLLISANYAGVHCWQNDGKGHFTDITTNAGILNRQGSLTMALADVDGDGTLDLYVANNRSDDIRDRGMGQVQMRMVDGKLTVPPSLTNRLGISNGEIFEYGEPDQLWLNDGKGRFQAASWTDGRFLDELGKPLAGPPLDWGLTATFRDLNGDGTPDIYICNDYWTPDRLWINDGHGHFRATPTLSLRQTSGSSMGVDIADINGDGHMDLFVVDMLSRLPSWRKRQMAAQADVINLPGSILDRPQSLRNTLQVARGDGTYAEVAAFAGLTASEWAWQPVFLDVDLDGRPDLLITTGHMRDVQDRDTAAIIQTRERDYTTITNAAERKKLFVGDRIANLAIYQPLTTPIVAFHNQGNLHFEEATAEWGTDQPGIHHGLALADLDGDGDLDLVVNNLNAPAAVYRNNSTAPRVAVRLKGRSPNTQAVGAIVTLHGGAIPEQRQEVISGGRYLSGSDPLLVFATGTHTQGMTLTIRWRNGNQRTASNIQPGRLYEFIETNGPDTPSIPTAAIPSKPLFEDASAHLDHSHAEVLFNDFQLQPLLPRRLSQEGPGIAWIDWNGDGWEDLAIAGGAGSSLAIYRNDQHGGFLATTNHPTRRDQLALASIGSNLFVLDSNYEDGEPNGPAVERIAPGQTPTTLLTATNHSHATLALGDVDGDGALDLFVGGGTTPRRWPEPQDSLLLKSRNGQFTPTQTFKALGITTSALWTDLTGDGFPELLVACQWGPLKLFHNNQGQLAPWDPEIQAWDAAGNTPVHLSTLTGWWTGLASGDFDGDGRLDFIAANTGLNSDAHPTPAQPAVLITGDWSGDGSLVTIETTWDPIRHALTPVRSLSELQLALPFLPGRFPTHRAYSEATIDEVLGAEKTQAKRYEIVEGRSLLFLNRGDHFEVRPLPLESQLAPAFTPVVADFDGDGHEDVFLSQNFFATRPGVSRMDAGRGLLLRGDGKGGWTPMPGPQSGLLIYGEQRGAATADFDHDGRPDLVVTQNAAATRLFRNANGRPGLRVRLLGPAGNPEGIGAVLRLRRGELLGPARELHAGSGIGSQDGSITILNLPGADPAASELLIRWPGGRTQTTAIPPGTKELLIHAPPASP